MISRILLTLAGFGIAMIVIRSVSGGGAAAAPGAFFPAGEQESASIVVAHHTDGSRHAAFTGYDGPTKDQIYYAACDDMDCGTSPENWRKAVIPFPRAKKIQLALTADGRPRLYVISYSAPEKTGYNRTYSYGECDSDCTDAASWRFVDVADSGDFDGDDSAA